MKLRFLAALACGIAFSVSAFAQSPSKLLRFPDIAQGRIVFVRSGDLYIVDANGGTAFRLTSHEGQELYPKFSPDGSQIAFSAEYNGTRYLKSGATDEGFVRGFGQFVQLTPGNYTLSFIARSNTANSSPPTRPNKSSWRTSEETKAAN